MTNTLNISITGAGNPSPNPLAAGPGDQITWTNNYSEPIDSFTLPTCVAPQTNPAPLAVGATTRKYTVNAGSKGTFSYSYGWSGDPRDTRDGTIDVESM